MNIHFCKGITCPRHDEEMAMVLRSGFKTFYADVDIKPNVKVSEWYKSGKDVLHLTGTYENIYELGHLQHTRFELLMEGWIRIEPIKVKIVCQCA